MPAGKLTPTVEGFCGFTVAGSTAATAVTWVGWLRRKSWVGWPSKPKYCSAMGKPMKAMESIWAVLSVTNTGPRIPPAEVERLFQPFQRLDRRRANYKDGHGLGLSIVRAIATAHGATITARAVPDGGLSVSVTFPQPASPTATPRSNPETDGRGRKIEMATP
jgi:signal transduction histidine kinase